MASMHVLARVPLLRRSLAIPIRSMSSLPPNLSLADPSLLDSLPSHDIAFLNPDMFRTEQVEADFIEAVVHPFGSNATEPGSIQLSSQVFGKPLRIDVLHNLVNWQRACKRQGTARTKSKGEVRGSTRKPWEQKGSGRARAGHRRAPHWRGGAKAHGRVQMDWSYKLNKKYRILGICTALSQKLAEGNMMVVNNLELDSFRTKPLAQRLKEFDLEDSLFLDLPDGEHNENFRIAASNLPAVKILASQKANVLDMLDYRKLVVTTAAVDALTFGLTKPIKRRPWQALPEES